MLESGTHMDSKRSGNLVSLLSFCNVQWHELSSLVRAAIVKLCSHCTPPSCCIRHPLLSRGIESEGGKKTRE
jgi:hypothetical protein